VVFGGVRELLGEQFDRLSVLEQSVLLWLAILREPVSLEELLSALSVPRAPVQVLEALDGLGRRSLIERGQRAASFTLQSVVLEYATARLIAELASEIGQGHLNRLIAYGLCQAQAKDYVRQAQEHLLVVPLLTRLRSMYQGHADLEARLLWLLDHRRGLPQTSQGYGPANLVALLRVLRGDLRGLGTCQYLLDRCDDEFWCIRCGGHAWRLLPRLAAGAPGVTGPLRRLRPVTPGWPPAGGPVSPVWPQQRWGGAG